jgi:hypothetical protein
LLQQFGETFLLWRTDGEQAKAERTLLFDEFKASLYGRRVADKPHRWHQLV